MASPRSAVTKKKKGKSATVKSAKPRAKSKKPAKAQPVKRRAKTSPRKKTPASKAKSAKSPKKPAAEKSKSPPKKLLLGDPPKILPTPAPAPPKPLGSYSFYEFAQKKLQDDQLQAASKIDTFLQSQARCLVVQGFAGTGKTFLLGLLNDYLKRMHRERRLMAPTGRAARMIRDRTNSPASTIHSAIYKFSTITRRKKGILFTLNFSLSLLVEEHHELIAIVDEASLVSDTASVSTTTFFAFGGRTGTGKLLTDLIAFLKLKDPTYKTKLILIGDPCQLPPVTDKSSFALDAEYLRDTHKISADTIVLNTVVRQSATSGVLRAATAVRASITDEASNFMTIKEDGLEVKSATRAEIIGMAASKVDVVPAAFTVITHGNEDALDYNHQIRLSVGREDLTIGDRLAICANNQLFSLLNGTFVRVVGMAADSERFIESGIELIFRDIDIKAEEPTPDGGKPIQTIKLLVSALDTPEPDISKQMQNALYSFCNKRFASLTAAQKAASLGLKMDLYFNAVRAKYGYAVTCHKAQGGEWPEVAIYFGKRKDIQSQEFRKWAYTALTRAKKAVYLEDAPEFHPLTRLKLPVANGKVPPDVRMKARLVDKYGMHPHTEFLSRILTDILTPHGIYLAAKETPTLQQCLRLKFTSASKTSGSKFTIIDFYYKGQGNEATFERSHAPGIQGSDAALAILIQDELAKKLLP
ncbi:MAG: AAA family ATPase [Verrucomicrobiae bacterium]